MELSLELQRLREVQYATFRRSVHEYKLALPENAEIRAWNAMRRAQGKSELRAASGGAPQLPVTLASLPGAGVTTNTYTTAQSILAAQASPTTGPLGPYSVDYFRTVGATWQQEAMGVISTTGTPTFAMGTYFGVAAGTITTVLCITPTLTTASALANFPWYYSAFGHTVTFAGATSTMLVQGLLAGNIVVLGNTVAGQAAQWAVNATPPTAVTTDLSTVVYLDLKGTWGTSSASNTTTTNMYKLTSLYS